MNKPRVTYRLSANRAHAWLDIWVNGANAGRITVRPEESKVLDVLVGAILDAYLYEQLLPTSADESSRRQESH